MSFRSKYQFIRFLSQTKLQSFFLQLLFVWYDFLQFEISCLAIADLMRGFPSVENNEALKTVVKFIERHLHDITPGRKPTKVLFNKIFAPLCTVSFAFNLYSILFLLRDLHGSLRIDASL